MPSVRRSLLAALAPALCLAVPTPAGSALAPRVTPDPLQGELAFLKLPLDKRQAPDASVVLPTLNAQGCLPGNTTALQMNLVLSSGGRGAKVVLCPSTTYPLNNTLRFTDYNQEISTLGYPTGGTRATLVVSNPQMAVAIWGQCDYCNFIQIRSVQVNGNRPALGMLPGAAALIELGGNAQGHVVRDSHIWEPRGWSALHTIEGYQGLCRNATIINNQIGPSGNSPNTATQFRKRQDGGRVIGGGEWADGISHSCKTSLVSGNIITDATDGAIVVFGSPGSIIRNNYIVAQNRVALGGINMVDVAGYGGNYTGTVVTGNTLIAAGSLIKIGIPIGPNTWGAVNATGYRVFDGTVSNNRFVSMGAGYFGYAIAATGANRTTVSGNDVSGARFSGVPSRYCIMDYVPKPGASGIFYDPYTTPGVNFDGQPNAISRQIIFLICVMKNEYGTDNWPTANVVAGPSSTAALAGAAAASSSSLPPSRGRGNAAGAAVVVSSMRVGKSSVQSAAANAGSRRRGLAQVDDELAALLDARALAQHLDEPSPWAARDVLADGATFVEA